MSKVSEVVKTKNASIKVPRGSYLCKFCQTAVPDGSRKTHEMGKKHKNQEQFYATRENSANRTIHVANLPPRLLDIQIADFFRQHGPVSKVILKPLCNYCFVEFNTPDIIPSLLKKQLFLLGKKLSVSVRKFQLNNLLNHQRQQPISSIDITKGKHAFVNFPSDSSVPFEDQLNNFVRTISLPFEEVAGRIEFVSRLSQDFQEFFPGSFLHVFGSSANGLGFAGCDVDISFFLPFERDEESLQENESHPSLFAVRTGEFKKEDLLKLRRSSLVRFLWRIIGSLPGFKHPKFIPSARCPLVKVYSTSLQLECDISFNKSLGLANTRLLHLYGKMDPRIHTLLMVLRFWGKREDLIGPNQNISSYAFTWLVIFYLQKRNFAPVFETLASLAETRVHAENWDCSFTENLSLLTPITRKDTLTELLVGFFEFCCQFDFTTLVICLRDGTCVLKSELIDLAGDELDFKITTMCIQDVFDLTHNITCGVSDASLQKFLLKTTEMFHKLRTKLETEGLQFTLLFDTNRYVQTDKEKAKIEQFNAKIERKTQEINAGEVKMEHLAEKVGQRYDALCQLILDIFEKALLFECFLVKMIDGKPGKRLSIEEAGHPSKKQKLDSAGTARQDLQQKHPQNGETVLLHVLCQVRHRTWVGRIKKNYSFELQSKDLMAAEESEALKTVKKTPPGYAKTKVLHELEAILLSSENVNEKMLKLRFVPKNKTEELKTTILPFLRKYIPSLALACIDNYLLKANAVEM